MRIATLEIILTLPGVHSLKDKRRIVKSVKDRIRNKFNVSIAEIDAQDTWGRAVLGVAAVSNDGRFLNSVMTQVINHIQMLHPGLVSDYHIEIQ